MSSANALTADLLIELPKRYLHIRCWRNNRVAAEVERDNGSKQWVNAGVDGQGDISGIVGPFGRRLEVEVKVGKDRLRPDQKAFRRMILERGGVYIEARDLSGALDSLELQLHGEEREKRSGDCERSGWDRPAARSGKKERANAAVAAEPEPEPEPEPGG